MDCLILFCALKLLDICVPVFQVFIASSASALGAVFLLKLQACNGLLLLLRPVPYVLLVFITVPPKAGSLFFRFAGLVFLLAALCGGLSLAVICIASGSCYMRNGQMLPLYLPSYILPCAICLLILCVLFLKKWLEDRRIQQNTARVQIQLKGKAFFCTGYFDSGNLHQHNGDPVLVVCASVFEEIFESMPCDGPDFLENHAPYLGLTDRAGLLVVKTVGGESLLTFFRPDAVMLDDVPMKAYIALIFEELDGEDRFRALLPAKIKKRV